LLRNAKSSQARRQHDDWSSTWDRHLTTLVLDIYLALKNTMCKTKKHHASRSPGPITGSFSLKFRVLQHPHLGFALLLSRFPKAQRGRARETETQ